jgi:LmbE family N-acetylglucosaminyl deacetylase
VNAGDERRTLLVALAHPDDEVGGAGAILAQRARGDRVVVVWMTHGSMTEAFGPVPPEEVVRRRLEQARAAAEILDVETRFLDFQDTRLEATPEAAARFAKVVAEVRPDGLLTLGDAWRRGLRHPDHQAAGKIARDAVTLARIRKVVEPLPPHREPVPVFTYRGAHSQLPAAVVDVEPHAERMFELGRFYQEAIGFGDPAWLERRMRHVGERWGLRFAEDFDAWETRPGVVSSLLPAEPQDPDLLPDSREGPVGG